AKNAYKYGFILRYPSDIVEITGVSYEPWQYRYVGKQAAREIQQASLTLEEYLAENNNKCFINKAI
ncbi:D-alanyl-D-alanine carboxypeptidase family protein, partial [Enterococcus faecium]|uniref:D-alanyl-D-alanine carboxypeptidase family protein n=1 Tax=Enterococcus faecium TaxID=1352 RepID=UPI0039FBDE18